MKFRIEKYVGQWDCWKNVLTSPHLAVEEATAGKRFYWFFSGAECYPNVV